MSPSNLDFPSLVHSPMTPNECLSEEEKEEKAIAEEKFYLHPYPIITPRGSNSPRLLPLFPMTSPRLSDDFTSTLRFLNPVSDEFPHQEEEKTPDCC